MTTAAQSVHDVADKLVGWLTTRRFAAGDRLPSIRKLAAELDAPTHAVRDALLHAQTIGLVRVRPRAGTFVQSVDFAPLVGAFERVLPRALTSTDANLLDLLEARRVIEVELIGAAAARRRLADLVPVKAALNGMYADPADYGAYVRQNEEFHLRAAEIGGNKVLVAVLQHLLSLLRAVLVERQPAAWEDRASRKRAADAREHRAIYAALLAGDPAAARAAARAHLRDTTDSLVPGRGPGGG